jgi:hypothetical protein
MAAFLTGGLVGGGDVGKYFGDFLRDLAGWRRVFF